MVERITGQDMFRDEETEDKIHLQIIDITEAGVGVGRDSEGKTYFVKDAVPGDLVAVEITKQKKRYAEARIVKTLIPSRHRAQFYCPYKKFCGGCPYGALQYPAQLKLKQKHVRDVLCRIAGLENPKVNEIIGMNMPYSYRNKAVLRISVNEQGEPKVGFYMGKTHTVVDCVSCRIQALTVNAVSEAIREFMKQDHISAYDEKSGKGLLQSVTVRTAFATGEVMVIFNVNGKSIPNYPKLIGMLDEAVFKLPKQIGGVEYSLESVYICPGKGAKPDYKKMECVAGKRTITEVLGDTKYEISPTAFFQVNPRQTEELYDKVFEYAGISDGDTVLDLYCGVGSIGLYLSTILCDKISVIGIESNRDAILNANRNAVINGIVNARYAVGKAEEKLKEILIPEGDESNVVCDDVDSVRNEDLDINAVRDEDDESGLVKIKVSHADVAILDPPRAGCDGALLKTTAEAGPERIVYVSCDPGTLARDIKILEELGYKFEEATPIDMFPNTGRVEVVALLKR